jgi:hypothetical protein
MNCYQQEWALFLNKGSKVDISYSIKSLGATPLSLVIAQGLFPAAYSQRI